VKTRVYVDGFNLYYGAVKQTQFKWLDPVRLSRLLLPATCTIDKPLYFTARVSGKVDNEAPARQETYLKALRSLPETEMHFGNFLGKSGWRPLTNLPVAGRSITTSQGAVTLPAGNRPVAGARPNTLPVGNHGNRSQNHKRRGRPAKPLPHAVVAESFALEEKGSDVNLAVHLLNDAWQDRFEAAAATSNDTDLVAPRPDGGFGAAKTRIHRLPRPMAGRPQAEKRRQLRTAHQASTPPCSAVRKPLVGHWDLETDQLANSRLTRGAAQV
jgi:hypothetical protein